MGDIFFRDMGILWRSDCRKLGKPPFQNYFNMTSSKQREIVEIFVTPHDMLYRWIASWKHAPLESTFSQELLEWKKFEFKSILKPQKFCGATFNPIKFLEACPQFSRDLLSRCNTSARDFSQFL